MPLPCNSQQFKNLLVDTCWIIDSIVLYAFYVHEWAHLTALRGAAIDLSPFQLGWQSGIKYDLRAKTEHMLNTTCDGVFVVC